MSLERGERKSLPVGPLVAIAAVVVVAAGAFAYTAGWLTPQRLTPEKLVAAVQPPTGGVPGHRRNHATGICFTGEFKANGAGSELSTASLLKAGSYPVVARLNLGGGDPHMADAMAQVRGFGLQITGPGGEQWRSAMIDAPFFAAPTPAAFYQFLTAAGSKDPSAVKGYIGQHPEVLTFIGWVKGHPRTESWTEDKFNSLNSFVFVDANGGKHTVRWSLVPANKAVALTADELKNSNPEFLQQDLVKRVGAGPQSWELMVTVANPGDPTADPTKAWPADRRTVDVGTLTAEKVEEEADGPCRDVVFDPTVLPVGMTTSDDGFPAARSAAYRVSFDRRTAEEKAYPHTAGGQQ